MSKEEVHEKIIYREVIREKASEPVWESGSFAGLLILTFIFPILGLIVGGVNLRHSERQAQAAGLIIGAIAFWVIWMMILSVKA